MGRWGGRESPHVAKDGGPGSGPKKGSGSFSGYRVGKAGQYDIHEGIGPHGGMWLAKGRGESKTFKSRKEAEEHGHASSEE